MKSVVVGTAGHIDHGKSALVQALTGTDPDRLKEERERGITIDLGFAHRELGDTNFAFVDVPGHERFIKNMLAGVGGIDLVLLVVAADESVMPQTREHFDICRLLDIPAGIVALTKADLVDRDGLGVAELEVRELLAGSFLEAAPIVPVSSRTGEGLDELRAALIAASNLAPTRSAEGVTRLPIDRVFTMKGFGTVVTGTLVSGRLRVDEELILEPGGRVVSVRGIQVHGRPTVEAVAGERTAVNLGGVDVADVERGQVLVAPHSFEPTRVADLVVEMLPDVKPLKHGARVRFHHGTAEILGRVSTIGPVDAQAGGTVAPGARAFVRLRLERPAVLTRGDRYILRAYSPLRTIAGGRILDPHPARSAIRTTAALERFARLDMRPPAGLEAELSAAGVMIEEAGPSGLPKAALVSRAGIEPGAVAERMERLRQQWHVECVGDVLVSTAVLEGLKSAILELLTQHHRAQPLSEGVPREEARARLFTRGHAAVFERALHDLERGGAIVARDRLMLTAHRVVLSPEESRAHDAIEQELRRAGLKPPDVAALATRLGVAPSVADRVVQLLQRQKRVVKIDTLLFHDEALKALKAQVAALKAGRKPEDAKIDVATFKARFDVSRKFAIPLLEYLDRERVTRRVGDARVIL
jgi:selenocysteine-specific elongation factor